MSSSKSPQDCMFHCGGSICKNGASCQYRHLSPSGYKALVPCQKWVAGETCKFGVDCRFRHASNEKGKSGAGGSSSAVATVIKPGMSKAEVTITTKITTAVKIKVDVAFLVDTSGSMSGSQYRTAIEAFKELFAMLNPTDKIALVGFDSEVRVIQPLVKKHNITQSELYAKIPSDARGCSTRLRDAMMQAKEILRDKPKEKKAEPKPGHVHVDRQKYLIVITDGDDNASSRANSAEVLREAIARPGAGFPDFHCAFVSVGVTGPALAEYKALTAPRHCYFYDVQDASKLKEYLQRAIQVVKVQQHSGSISGSSTRVEKLAGDLGKLAIGAGFSSGGGSSSGTRPPPPAARAIAAKKASPPRQSGTG